MSKAQVMDHEFDTMLQLLLSHSVPEIPVSEASNSPDIIFLDAREREEFGVSHIKDAVHVGYKSFDLKSLQDVAKDKNIIVYCSVGYRSEKVAEKLKNAGYKNVSNLYGGIFEWVNEGKPVYDTTGHLTPRVHAYDLKWGIWLDKGEKVY